MISAAPQTAGRLLGEALVAGYREMEILHGVSIAVAGGEFVTVLGPNGSGKSTLLKTLCGLLTVKRGAIWLLGNDVTRASARDRLLAGMCYVPQVRGVFASMSVMENLEMGAFAKRASEVSDAFERVFTYFPRLAERRRQIAGSMSGGEQQMVAIGRALIASPSVLLLDEPSAGLSPAAVDDLFGRIRNIANDGVSIVLVEQNAAKALEVSDRAYVLADGVNRLEGPALHVLHDPEVRRLYLGGD
ncbi:ABC transporter ATP-binding protein [bacterium]|nr:MAG: ABC transporter ATP-binding protein [bacterium]